MNCILVFVDTRINNLTFIDLPRGTREIALGEEHSQAPSLESVVRVLKERGIDVQSNRLQVRVEYD